MMMMVVMVMMMSTHQQTVLVLLLLLLLFVTQNSEDLGANGGMGQNSQSKMSYLESLTLICLFTMQLLWGYDDD